MAGTGATTVKYQLTRIPNDKKYNVQIRAKNANGESGASNTANVYVPAQPPATITSLTASKVDGNPDAIKVTWDDPEDDSITAYWYRYWQTDHPWSAWTSISGATATTTSFMLDDLTLQRAYFFQVRSRNPKEYSDPSNEAKLALGTKPAQLTGLTATAGERSVTITWDDPNDSSIRSYQFRLRLGDSSDWRKWRDMQDHSPTTFSYTIKAPKVGTVYHVQIRAHNPVGISRKSAEASATPTAPSEGGVGERNIREH